MFTIMKNLFFLLPLLFLLSCGSADQNSATNTTGTLSTGQQPDLPQMMYLESGKLLAWWTEKDPENGDAVVAMSISEDESKTFSKPVQIPETRGVSAAHGESLPALVQKPDRSLVMVFSSKNEEAEFRFAGSVKYIQSFDGGDSWSKPEIVHVSDTNIENSHSFVAATLLADGEIGTVWLDGRHKLDHSVMYFAKTNGREGFTEDYRIGGPTCQCCKNSMLTDESGTLHITYRGLTDGTRDIMHFKSNDNGQTFTKPVKVSDDGWKIDACPHNGPAMTKAENGDLHFIWYSLAGGEGLFYALSVDNGESFSPRVQISDNPVAKHPHLVVNGDKAVAVWDELKGNGKDARKRAVLSVINEHGLEKTIPLSAENQDGWAPNVMKLQSGELLAMWVESTGRGQRIKYKRIDTRSLEPETLAEILRAE